MDLTSKFYSNILKQATQYGIDCKVYGAICAISEIKNAVPLVHGPEGCAYYPSFFPTDALRMKLLGERYPPPIYSTAMTEPHVIYGGENRLEDAIVELDRREKPELIGVIGSCVPAIIGDDLEEVVSKVRNVISAAVIATPSSGYDDDRAERQYIDDIARNTINAWNDNNKEELKFGIEKCGRLDAMYSLVEQLTEDQGYKDDKSVNIDTFGRLHYYEDLKGEMEEIRMTLNKIGIKVNMMFPGCSVSDIKRMPAAELNFMRRSENAAKYMQKEYDMDYLFDPLCVKYTGLDGIERFYMDIASKFNLEGEAEDVLKNVQSALDAELGIIRKQLKDKAFSVVLVPMTISVEYLKMLEFIGLNIKVLFINTEWLERFGTKKEYTDAIANELREHANKLGIEAVFTNLEAFEEVKKAKETGVDLALVDTLTDDEERTMLYEQNGVKAMSPSLCGYSAYRISYAMITRLGEEIVRKMENRLPKRKLLFFDYAVNGWRFPCLEDTLHCRICWEEMMNVWRS